jgi:hypothetical protein
MKTDKVEVIRWLDEQSPDEQRLRNIMADEGLHPYVWSNGPGDVYAAHRARVMCMLPTVIATIR